MSTILTTITALVSICAFWYHSNKKLFAKWNMPKEQVAVLRSSLNHFQHSFILFKTIRKACYFPFLETKATTANFSYFSPAFPYGSSNLPDLGIKSIFTCEIIPSSQHEFDFLQDVTLKLHVYDVNRCVHDVKPFVYNDYKARFEFKAQREEWASFL